MRTNQLGSAGPRISIVGCALASMLGSDLGPDARQDAIDALRAGFEQGVDWVDAAEVPHDGVSETVCSEAVQGFGHVRVFTKVAPGPDGTGFTPEQVRAACTASLARLGRERIDLNQLYWPDPAVPLEDTWGAMAALVDEGLVAHIGLANFDRAMVERCEAIRHVDSLQRRFSLLMREDADLLAWCHGNGTGVIVNAPLAFGLLTGSITMETTFHDGDWRSGQVPQMRGGYEMLFAPEARARHLALIDRLRPLADRLGLTMTRFALAWILQQPGVAAVISGGSTAEDVAGAARAGEVTLDEQTLDEVAAILA